MDRRRRWPYPQEEIRIAQHEGVSINNSSFEILTADVNHPIRNGGRGTLAGEERTPQAGTGAGVQRNYTANVLGEVCRADINHPFATAGEEYVSKISRIHSTAPVLAFRAYTLLSRVST